MTSSLPCPLPLEVLLVCSDESPASQGAVKAALDLAQACGSRVVLLHALEFYPLLEYAQPDALGLPPVISQELIELRERTAREHLEKWRQEAVQQGVEVEIRLSTGVQAYVQVLEVADEVRPGVILMGRRGASGLERLLVGSVTARVIGHTHHKVLVVPRDAVLGFERLVLASDGSPAGRAAAQVAMEISRRTDGRLIAVTAAYGDLDPKRAKAVVRELATAAKEEGLDFDSFTPGGRPEDAIIEVAAAKQADLIIMGSHGRTGLKRLFLGSVAERVIGQAACPVLVVKQAPQ